MGRRTRSSARRNSGQRFVTLPSVAAFAFDAKSLSHVVFPSDFVGSKGPEFFWLDLDYVVMGPDGVELERLPVQFERRWVTPNTVDMWGFDSTKTLEVHVRARRDGSWTCDMRSSPKVLYASNAQLVLRLLEFLRPPNAVALTTRGSAPDSITPIQEAVAPPPPEGLPKYIDALASLEAYVGKPIVIPESESDADRLRELDVARQLLAGDVVQGQWDQNIVHLTATQARELVKTARSEKLVSLALVQPWYVHVGEEQYTIPEVTVVFQAARVAESPADLDTLPGDTDVAIRLVPADDERAMTISLRSARQPSAASSMVLNDDPVTRVSAEFFDELLTSLDEPDEPLPELAGAAARLREIQAQR